MKTTVILYFVPVYILFMLVEAYASRKRLPGNYKWQDAFASISMGAVYAVIAGIVGIALIAIMSFFHQYRIFSLKKVWWTYVLLIFAEDYCFYWAHRMSHQLRLLWNSHETHHSSVYYNFTTAVRQPWTGIMFVWVFWAPLVLLGFPLEWIILQQALNLTYQFFLHTRFIDKLGPLEWIFNTPSHHRVHHGTQVQYLDRNYAGIFIIWDRLHGTFAQETEAPAYGTLKPLHFYNPIKIEFHTWQDMWNDLKNNAGWKQRLQYIFCPPGWRHDGTGMTVQQLQQHLSSRKSGGAPERGYQVSLAERPFPSNRDGQSDLGNAPASFPV